MNLDFLLISVAFEPLRLGGFGKPFGRRQIAENIVKERDGVIKVYTDILSNQIKVGYQENGKSHEAYKKLNFSNMGPAYHGSALTEEIKQ
jgi:hypothetical protein